MTKSHRKFNRDNFPHSIKHWLSAEVQTALCNGYDNFGLAADKLQQKYVNVIKICNRL